MQSVRLKQLLSYRCDLWDDNATAAHMDIFGATQGNPRGQCGDKQITFYFSRLVLQLTRYTSRTALKMWDQKRRCDSQHSWHPTWCLRNEGALPNYCITYSMRIHGSTQVRVLTGKMCKVSNSYKRMTLPISFGQWKVRIALIMPSLQI
jgi:hypothetical protein